MAFHAAIFTVTSLATLGMVIVTWKRCCPGCASDTSYRMAALLEELDSGRNRKQRSAKIRRALRPRAKITGFSPRLQVEQSSQVSSEVSRTSHQSCRWT